MSLESLQLLRAELTSVEDRAKLVIPVQLTGLVALWLSIVDFDKGLSRGLAGAGLALLLVAMFSSLYLVRPRPILPLLRQPYEKPASGEDPTMGGVEANIAAMLSQSWVHEAERLRRCLICAIILCAVALVAVIAAYLVDLFWGGPPP